MKIIQTAEIYNGILPHGWLLLISLLQEKNMQKEEAVVLQWMRLNFMVYTGLMEKRSACSSWIHSGYGKPGGRRSISVLPEDRKLTLHIVDEYDNGITGIRYEVQSWNGPFDRTDRS